MSDVRHLHVSKNLGIMASVGDGEVRTSDERNQIVTGKRGEKEQSALLQAENIRYILARI